MGANAAGICRGRDVHTMLETAADLTYLFGGLAPRGLTTTRRGRCLPTLMDVLEWSRRFL